MKTRLALAALFAITAAIYLTLWSAPALTWDDGSNIFQNPFYTMHMWWGVWTDAYYGLYVPVTSSAWAFLFWLGERAAWPFRAFNLALHLANTALVYILLSGLARRWSFASRWPAVLATAGFALHPLQVESVAWISAGRDLLSTFFALAATAVYFAPRPRPKANYVLATFLFALALLSKPNVAILPAAILLLDIFLEKTSWKKSARRMTPWFFLSLVAIYLTQLAQVEHFTNNVDWWQRPVVVANTYGFYLQKLFWPHPLSGNYAITPESLFESFPWRALIAALWIAALIALAWRFNRRYLIGVLALVLLLPVSGIVPFGYENISGVADHYMYLPMAAVAAILLLIWERLGRKNAILLALPVALSAAWAYASYARTQVWENDQAFFTDMSNTAPAAYSTALGMSVVMCEDVKNYDAGIRWTEVALKAKPDDILALANRAFCLTNAGRSQEVLSMDFYLDRFDHEKMAAEHPTPYASLIASIGTAMIREEDYMTGYQYLCEAQRIMPSEPNYANNLKVAADILREHGIIEPTCATDTDDDGAGE